MTTTRAWHVFTLALALLVGGAGGFLAGRHPGAAAAQAKACPPPPRCPASPSQQDVSAARAQLAICLAYRPLEPEPGHEAPEDSAKALTACKDEQRRTVYNRQIGDCMTFERMVPFYERALADESGGCQDVLHWATTAKLQLASCRRGLESADDIPDYYGSKLNPPEDFKEKYAAWPIEGRPLVRTCLEHTRPLKQPTKEEMEEFLRTTHLQDGRTLKEVFGDAGVRMMPPVLDRPPAPANADP